MIRFRHWAAIALPIVLLARAVLLIFQLGSEHDRRAHSDEPPAWPPVEGEVLAFHADTPGIVAWTRADRHPIVAVVLLKNTGPQPPDAACLLDPDAMGSRGGRLTLRGRNASGLWQADWDGHRTMRTRDEVNDPEPDPAVRAAEAALLDRADFGHAARLELSEAAVTALIDTLAGHPPTTDVPPPRANLNIHAVLPTPAR